MPRYTVYTLLEYYHTFAEGSNRTPNHKVFDDRTDKLIIELAPSRGFSLFRLKFESGERVAAYNDTVSVQIIGY